MQENFGAYLKHERELRGVPLEEIASVTKIHIRFLRALEENDFDALPGEVFVKGFIRAYAKAIGSNEEDLVNAYDQALGESRAEEAPESQVEKERRRDQRKAKLGYLLIGLFLAALIGLGAFLFQMFAEKKQAARGGASAPAEILKPEEAPLPAPGEKIFEAEKELPAGPEPPKKSTEQVNEIKEKTAVSETVTPPPPEEPSSPSLPAEPGPTPAEPEKVSDLSEKEVIIQNVKENAPAAEPAVETEVAPLRLTIKVEENSWFNMTIDDAREEDFILPSGSQKTFSGRERFRITIGNKNGTQLFLNGEPLNLPESPDEVIRDFEVTAQRIDNPKEE